MPARVVLVHDEPGFVDELATALRSAGHRVATFPDPLAAWGALEAAQLTEVLVTRVEFQAGKSNGIALARMARMKRPDICILFTALPEYVADTKGVGVFMPLPVSVPEVVATVERLLKHDGENAF
jgi:two-component system, OmpR family, response regulator